MQPLSGNQRPGLNMSAGYLSCIAIAKGRASLQNHLKLLQNPHVWFTFDKVQNPLRLPCKKIASRLQTVLRDCQFLTLPNVFLTSSYHSSTFLFSIPTAKSALNKKRFWHFRIKTRFDIATSKNAPMLKCFLFLRFDLKTCFPPQPRGFSISHTTRCLRTRRFSEPTFRPFLPFRAIWSSFF